ncbi:hypothetical protein H6771_00760 [Candidatus Peribacteria bacterium]|nr:hypothetical protein [Candidatus Peribacteria bacterium]
MISLMKEVFTNFFMIHSSGTSFLADRLAAQGIAPTDWSLHWPGGNTTLLIDNRHGGTPEQRYPSIALQAMEMLPAIEQVEYIVPGEHTALRLHMMGGDVCFNGLRSLAHWAARRYGYTQLPLECAGSPHRYSATIEGPAEQSVITLQCPQGFTQRDDLPFPAVDMGGIIHLVAAQSHWDEHEARQQLQSVLRQCPWLASTTAAVGLITVVGQRLYPLVHVFATNTTVLQSACGSGTVAAHLITGQEHWYPPSGVLFSTTPRENQIHLRAIVRGYSPSAAPEPNHFYYDPVQHRGVAPAADSVL